MTPLRTCLPSILPKVPNPGAGPDNNILTTKAALSVAEGPQFKILFTVRTDAPPFWEVLFFLFLREGLLPPRLLPMIGYKRNEPRHNIHIFIVPLTILSIHRRKVGPLKYRRIESPFRPFPGPTLWQYISKHHWKVHLL